MKNLFIKHKEYRDVCWLVLRAIYLPGRDKLKCELWNQGFVDSYRMGIRQEIVLDHTDKQNWLYCYGGVDCLRYADWKQFNG